MIHNFKNTESWEANNT